VYLDENGDMNKVMDDVIDGIIKVLNHIKDIVGTPELHHIQIEKLIKACITDWHNMGITSWIWVSFG
jgi:hypothetical protein